MFGASSELAPNMFGASSELASVMEFRFNWTTRGYANSRIANSRTGQVAEWSTRGIADGAGSSTCYGRPM